MIVVCPAEHLPAIMGETGATHVLTIASPGRPRPTLPAGTNHLHLVFHDLADERPGFVPPNAEAVEALLAWGRVVPPTMTLVLCCELGVSRSPAAAFALACQAHPDRPEDGIAAALREASPVCTPNARVVALADRALGREGRMRRAIRAIGRGANYQPCRSFVLALGRTEARA